MNYQNYKTTDFIFKANKAISYNLCDFLIQKSETYPWQKHVWYKPNLNSEKSEITEGDNKELERAGIDKVTQMQVAPIIDKYVDEYKNQFNISTPLLFKSPIHINRYHSGSRMKQHVDHIHSCFDGEKKGIPVISVVGLLNDDFTGGEFIFWNDYKVTLNKGDLLFFPSLFIYQHKVNEVITGTRYSIVTWVW